ncbi:lysylphosphatidylglycerol synthase transmembrane domain-containing protein [Halosolutus gelatinilyticus]|uniref:lysylphosphatidylglycerol synthase transmembrane domain-containing protein n=1 Tax=Halosolutus gelatinilyticus TaxID=2931975 RepID=UPI001FF6778C|nr:lysylphosphatidylglycerol synthase transmembrane domain-containing protein [Halosolutus gelatinilyticus]
MQRRQIVAGFVGAGIVLAGLLWQTDLEAVLSALSQANPLWTVVLFMFACLWIFAWGLTLRTVLSTLDVGISIGNSGIVYSAVVFANNVTPFGQAGGEPVSALTISSVTDTQYEKGLAGIATVDVLNVVSSLVLVFFGFGVYASSFTLVPRVRSIVGTGLGVAVVIIATFVVVWRYRSRLVDPVVGALAGIVASIGGRLPGSASVTKTDVTARIDGFFDHLKNINADRSTLAVALVLSMSGWVLQSVALAAAFRAIGPDISIAVLLFVIPLANLAGFTPVPGGLGAIEAAFVALLVPTTGIDAPTVTASVLLFRAAIYWMPVLVGGTFTAVQVGGTLE